MSYFDLTLIFVAIVVPGTIIFARWWNRRVFGDEGYEGYMERKRNAAVVAAVTAAVDAAAKTKPASD